MNKVFVLPAGEDWIVDRFVKEWNEDNFDISVKNAESADVVWMLASWCWNHLPYELLKSKKVIATIHHIVPEKFDNSKIKEFLFRDQFVDAYHVYTNETKGFIESLTKKPVQVISYWANQKIWKKTGSKQELRKKYSLSSDCFLIGSFQRDSEGTNTSSPKLEKGPDLLVDYLVKVYEDWKNKNIEKVPHVLLAGWRRNFIINELNKFNIPYSYFERPNQQIINELYQCLDLYPVTSRYEGGPQSLIECGLLKINVISRNVGIADQVLPSSAIDSEVYNAIPAVPNVSSWQLPYGYQPYREFLKNI